MTLPAAGWRRDLMLALVIAVEYAVLPKFGGNSFGVPVTFALDLLEPRRTGRKKPA